MRTTVDLAYVKIPNIRFFKKKKDIDTLYFFFVSIFEEKELSIQEYKAVWEKKNV